MFTATQQAERKHNIFSKWLDNTKCNMFSSVPFLFTIQVFFFSSFFFVLQLETQGVIVLVRFLQTWTFSHLTGSHIWTPVDGTAWRGLWHKMQVNGLVQYKDTKTHTRMHTRTHTHTHTQRPHLLRRKYRWHLTSPPSVETETHHSTKYMLSEANQHIKITIWQWHHRHTERLHKELCRMKTRVI